MLDVGAHVKETGCANTDTREKLRHHKLRLSFEKAPNSGKERRHENLSAHALAIGEPVNPARVVVYVRDNYSDA